MRLKALTGRDEDCDKDRSDRSHSKSIYNKIEAQLRRPLRTFLTSQGLNTVRRICAGASGQLIYVRDTQDASRAGVASCGQ